MTAARITKDDILRIAQQKGSFRTTLRWRDEALDRKCCELVKEGMLRRSRDWDTYKNRAYVPAREERLP